MSTIQAALVFGYWRFHDVFDLQDGVSLNLGVIDQTRPCVYDLMCRSRVPKFSMVITYQYILSNTITNNRRFWILVLAIM